MLVAFRYRLQNNKSNGERRYRLRGSCILRMGVSECRGKIWE